MTRRTLPLAALLAFLTLPAVAADSLLPDGLTVTASVSNEYMFRGIAQTRGEVATCGSNACDARFVASLTYSF